MNGAPFRPIGGAVVADHGPLSLATARDLAAFYRREGAVHAAAGAAHAAETCARRAETLTRAIAATVQWRRAAGWADPDAADR